MKLAGILIGSAFAKGIIKETRSCEGTCNSQNRDCTKDCRVGDLQCLSACSRAYDKCLQECRGNQLNFVVFDPEKDSQVKVTWLYQSQDGKDEVVVPRTLNPSYNDRKYMCSFKVNGEFHIIGGRSDSVSSVEYRHFKMEPYKAVQLEQMPFPFRNGICADFKSGMAALACAASSNAKGCWSYDGSKWIMVGSTQNDHFDGAISSFNGGAIIVGGYRDRRGSTEFFDESEPFATQWQVKGETAEFEQYDDFSAVEVGGFVWSFGGSKLSKKSGSSVFKMNNSFIWERHPQQMAFSRSGHRVVKDGEMIYIAGGAAELPVEMWEYKGGSFDIYSTTSYKTFYMRSYAELMVVDSNW